MDGYSRAQTTLPNKLTKNVIIPSIASNSLQRKATIQRTLLFNKRTRRCFSEDCKKTITTQLCILATFCTAQWHPLRQVFAMQNDHYISTVPHHREFFLREIATFTGIFCDAVAY
jgi:hypothetical protein